MKCSQHGNHWTLLRTPPQTGSKNDTGRPSDRCRKRLDIRFQWFLQFAQNRRLRYVSVAVFQPSQLSSALHTLYYPHTLPIVRQSWCRHPSTLVTTLVLDTSPNHSNQKEPQKLILIVLSILSPLSLPHVIKARFDWNCAREKWRSFKSAAIH